MDIEKSYESEKYIIVTPENVEEVFSKLSIKSMYFNSGKKIGNFLFEETDYEHPFVIDTSTRNFLYINEEWYNDHLEEGREILRRILLANQAEKFEILSDSLIDDSLLDSIKASKTIKKLNLGLNYSLTSSAYEKLKDSSIEVLVTEGVEDELKDIYEPFIDYNWNRSLIGFKSYSQLIKAKSVTITKEEELEYFHLLPLDCEIRVKFQDENLVNRVIASNHPGLIVIEVENKKAFNQYLKAHPIENQNAIVLVDGEKVDLSLYVSLEETLDSMVKGAEGLSPLEKYLYVYNIVKQYKDYNENNEDKMSARNLYQILQNEYMVCVGFSNMLIDLCTRVGIPAHSISTAVDISYDKSDAGKEQLEIQKPMQKGHHARTQVYIQDPKYKIDGYYLADATWDNDLTHDSYLYALMSVEERLAANRFIISDYSKGEEFFDCQSLDIFYAKVNRALDLLEPKNGKEISGTNLIYRSGNLIQQRKAEQEKIRNLKKIVDAILKQLIVLNPAYVANLKEQYPFLEDITMATKQNYYDVITELGHHLVPMCNKQINGADIFRAIKEVYARSGYTGEDLSAKLVETLNYNKKAYDRKFQTRFREYQDGHTDIYKSVPNKYDIPIPAGLTPQLEVRQQLETTPLEVLSQVEEESVKLR